MIPLHHMIVVFPNVLIFMIFMSIEIQLKYNRNNVEICFAK